METEMTKSPSTMWWLATIVVAAVCLFIGYAYGSSHGSLGMGDEQLEMKTPSQTSGQTAAQTGNRPSPFQSLVGTKLADAPFAQSAYLLSTSTLSADTKAALAGFSLSTSTNADGSMVYTLTASNPEYQNQTYTLTAGQQLYFIEMMLGDDQEGNENNMRDDHAVVVDQNGVIVQQDTQTTSAQ